MAFSGWIQQRRPLIFLFLLLAAILPVLVQIAWPFLTAFILASVIAIIISPIKEWVTRLAALTPLDPGIASGILRTIHDSVIANVYGMLAGEDRLQSLNIAAESNRQ